MTNAFRLTWPVRSYFARYSTPPELAFARGNSQSGVLLNAGLASNFRITTANTGVAGAPPATLGTRTAASTAWWLALS